MADLMGKCVLTIFLLLVLFYMTSIPLEWAARLRLTTISERLVYGFLAYFLVFECVALPMILTGQPFHRLQTVWLVVLGICLVAAILLVLFASCGRLVWNGGHPLSILLIAAALVVVVALAVLSACQRYIAWDPEYYIGTISTTLYTDTMYVYDGADGTKDAVINLRYAMSGLYMQFTIWCSLFSIPARTMAWFVMRPLCVLLAGLSVYRIGAEANEGRASAASGLVLLWAGVSFFWTGLHTTAYFLFVRGYEAKGYCANVILPMLLCACLVLLRGRKRGQMRGRADDEGEAWRRLALVSWASVPVSMSSMAIVPAGVAVLALVLLVTTRRPFSIFRNAVICVLPNVCVVVVYLLFKLEIIQIATRG